MQLEHFLAHPDLVSLLRLVVALVLSALIGWERESTGKAAGLRTHMLVAVGAATFVILGEHMVRHFDTQGHAMEIDPMRIIQAVVVGIGFLGAGTIFVLRHDRRVVGLTTAASIWATAGVGMLAGLGSYLVAVFATVLIVAILRLPSFIPGMQPKDDDARQ